MTAGFTGSRTGSARPVLKRNSCVMKTISTSCVVICAADQKALSVLKPVQIDQGLNKQKANCKLESIVRMFNSDSKIMKSLFQVP